jgi:hypothetical protein
MKTNFLTILIISAGLAFSGCQKVSEELPENLSEKNSGEVKAGDITAISFDSEKHEFGKIEEGTKVKHTFKFTNTGKKPLIVDNVKPSCGCTTPSWTKTPVMPNETGIIEVEYDSKGVKPGSISKTVTVFSNTEPREHTLKFTGEVVAGKK